MSIRSTLYGLALKGLNRAKQRQVTRSLGGFNWSLDLNNALDVHLIKVGVYHRVMPQLFKTLDPKSAAIDVGANCGYWTLPLADHFSFLVSIEADAENFERLKINISINPHLNDRVLALNVAATNYDGDALFNIRRSIDADANLNTGLSSLVIGGSDGTSRSVKAVQIDSLDLPVDISICFIKIDVEGAEFDVLTGAERLIKTSLPHIFWEATLSLDLNFKRKNVLLCWEFLQDLDYKHFIVLENGEISECASFDDLKSLGFDIDVLSVHESKVEDFSRIFNNI